QPPSANHRRERFGRPGQSHVPGGCSGLLHHHDSQLERAELSGTARFQRKSADHGNGEMTRRRRKNQRGLTLVELIVAFTIMLVLTSMAVPLARSKVRVTRERDLRRALVEMRAAVDKYKDYA